jgi:hypothetical protein
MAGKSNITFKHKGIVNNNELYLYDVDFYKEDIERHNSLKVYIEIHQEEEMDHTLEQMRYFRGPVTNIALESNAFNGYDKNEFQDLMKWMFLSEKKDIKLKDGTYKEVTHVPSLGSLKKKQMTHFIERVIQFLAEENIIVKSPNEFYGKD